jgi:hypothetical protein
MSRKLTHLSAKSDKPFFPIIFLSAYHSIIRSFSYDPQRVVILHFTRMRCSHVPIQFLKSNEVILLYSNLIRGRTHQFDFISFLTKFGENFLQ